MTRQEWRGAEGWRREGDGGREAEEQAAGGGRPSRPQSLTGLGVGTVARPRRRGSWPRPGPLPSSSQPPSEDARSTCNRPSHAHLQRQGHEPGSQGRWLLGGRITRDLPRKPPSCPGKACLLLGRLRLWPAVLSSLLALATLLPGHSWRGPPERLSLCTWSGRGRPGGEGGCRRGLGHGLWEGMTHPSWGEGGRWPPGSFLVSLTQN